MAPLYVGADLADSFALPLPADATGDADQLARAVFADTPRWMRGLLAMRDVLVTPFGIKTSRQLRTQSRTPSDFIAFFRVVSRSPSEVIVGEDDRHLDFRTSVLVRPGANVDARTLIVSTIVRCHNPLGQTYLLAIRPFHVVVVRSLMTRAARRGWPTRLNG